VRDGNRKELVATAKSAPAKQKKTFCICQQSRSLVIKTVLDVGRAGSEVRIEDAVQNRMGTSPQPIPF
jgi:hypothetical protein